ncbi:hypothetical protein CWATWH0402_6401 [Crocosphaera watsonii WH 0402]|uniref:Uncharacterized protein n=2 Tax=Crocosphaera watsonii TaxID=263511 RepID=T2JI52_CROWT|nr:hypothetical protein CWATWH0005_4293 [Crocosphaera watsonii WH 0005]CCQ65498.1 hypothetical protein CWATWH0402_6401 [Crocosphaera watsonii WH 0402]
MSIFLDTNTGKNHRQTYPTILVGIKFFRVSTGRWGDGGVWENINLSASRNTRLRD